VILELEQAVKINKTKGFTLIELMIVIAIMSIVAAIASLSWQRYVSNANLRTAARNVISDFQNCKAKAISESRDYQILFTTGTNSSYTISAPATSSHVAISTNKLFTEFDSGIQIVFEDICNGFFGIPVNVIKFETRGTSNNGCVKLTNTRGSKVSITTNVTGKSYVSFAMQ